MTNLRTIAAIGTIALLTSLLMARVHPFGDAGLYQPHPARAPLSPSIPPDVRDLLVTKCADCHSEQTRTPFYGRFAPVSWLIERDILVARKQLDFSAWDTYSLDQQEVLKSKIVQQTKSGAMPLPQYRIIHRQTAITPSDEQRLTNWVHADHVDSQLTPESSLAIVGDAQRGRLVFEKRCVGCHSFDANREGPNLRGVYGHTAGQAAGFPYSTVLKNSYIVWNDVTLDRWLTDPSTFIPGTDMDLGVAKPQERQDVIRFFKDSAPK